MFLKVKKQRTGNSNAIPVNMKRQEKLDLERLYENPYVWDFRGRLPICKIVL